MLNIHLIPPEIFSFLPLTVHAEFCHHYMQLTVSRWLKGNTTSKIFYVIVQ